jgi:hypothetical protein
MKDNTRHCVMLGAAALLLHAAPSLSADPDPLPSWAAGPVKEALISFVTGVTARGGPGYVPPEDRIATFDNDGTLWIEKPHYVELMYLLAHIKKRASAQPEWGDREPFRNVLRADRDALDMIEAPDMLKLSIETFAEMTAGEFRREAGAWLEATRDRRFARRYVELVYVPQLELMNYLRGNGFKVYICTGGGVDFLRIFSAEVYGVPWENVIGSHPRLAFREQDGKFEVMRKLGEGLVNDKDYKPIDIELHLGRRPILAFGNSDGDIEMLEWTESDTRPFLSLLLVHDDPAREYAYTKRSGKALELAKKQPWTLVSMKRDWRRVFAFEGN